MLARVDWAERYRNRYDWALTAYDKFVRELMPDIAQQIQSSDRTTVVVYGATQVGKTTLILELLGLNKITRKEVDKVLRGGQEQGKSATATPIRYGRSKDEFWYINSDEKLTSDQACNELRSIRKGVEEGEFTKTEMVFIFIPNSYFSQETNKLSVDINIIDIPGIQSLSAEEVKHVSNIAKKYVSVADLVLLVGTINRLGFLNPEDLEIDVLAEWAFQPLRFRIVLTFGFSNGSLHDKFLKCENLDVDRVREEVINEIKTHDYVFPEQFREKLYILEVGDSLNKLINNQGKYYKEIFKINNSFRDKLLSDIKIAASPYSRVHAAFDLDSIIKSRLKLLRLDFNGKLFIANTELEKTKDMLYKTIDNVFDLDFFNIKESIEYTEKRVSRFRDAITFLNNKLLELQKNHDSYFFEKESVSYISMEKQTVSSLYNFALNEEKKIKRKINIYNSEQDFRLNETVNKFDVSVEAKDIVSYQRSSELEEVLDYLNEFKVDTYYLSKNYINDMNRVKNALKVNISENSKLLSSSIRNAIIKSIKKIESNIETEKKLYYILSYNNKKITAGELRLNAIRSEYANKLWEMRYSLRIAKTFEQRIISEFTIKINSVKNKIYTDNDPYTNFYSILEFKMLIDEYGKLYSSIGLR